MVGMNWILNWRMIEDAWGRCVVWCVGRGFLHWEQLGMSSPRHDIRWRDSVFISRCHCDSPGGCRYNLYEKNDAASCLKGNWIVIAGSSNTLLELLDPKGYRWFFWHFCGFISWRSMGFLQPSCWTATMNFPATYHDVPCNQYWLAPKIKIGRFRYLDCHLWIQNDASKNLPGPLVPGIAEDSPLNNATKLHWTFDRMEHSQKSLMVENGIVPLLFQGYHDNEW